MIGELSAISEKALGLSSSDRATLAHMLIRSLDNQDDRAASDQWHLEIERRSTLVAEGKISERPAADALKDLRRRLTS